MATLSNKRQRNKTTLAVLRNKLTFGEKLKVVRSTKCDTSYSQQPVPARLKVETVAAWLGCSTANVKDIESRKAGRKLKGGGRLVRELTPEQAELVARQTGVNLPWLLENNPAKPILNWKRKPYTQADFDERQAELKARKESFASPKSLLDMARPRAWLAEYFGMMTAVLLRGLEQGQADVLDYKLRKAIWKIYGQPTNETPREWNDLIMTARFHGKPSLTRPDVGPLLDLWEARFKEIANRKSQGKAPLAFPKQARSRPAVRLGKGKRAKRKASRR